MDNNTTLYQRFINSGLSQRKFARQLVESGEFTTLSSARHKIRRSRGRKGQLPSEEISTPSSDITISENPDGSITAQSSGTVPEILDTLGVNLSEWSIKQLKTWNSGESSNVSVSLTPVGGDSVIDIIKDLRSDVRNFIPRIPRPPVTDADENLLLEIGIFDPHFGKVARRLETNAEYNFEIAKDLWWQAVFGMLKRVETFPLKRILLPLGNDLFHVDNLNATTTAGTQVGSEMSVRVLFREVRSIIKATIYRLLEAAPVDVVVIPGNHDYTVSYFLGEALDDFFHGVDAVTVFNQPIPRKYYQWDKVGLGFTHGNKEAPAVLPMLMANEMPAQMWAETQYREFHLGHFHLRRDVKFTPLQTVGGVTIRYLPSYSYPDNWHTEKGFTMGAQVSEGYLWDGQNGLVGIYPWNASRT